MMVWVALLVRKGVGAVKKIMLVGDVLTVMMEGYCDARNVLSPYILAMLCIALRYDRLLLYLIYFVTLMTVCFNRSGMVPFSRNHRFTSLAFAYSLDMEGETVLLQHQDRSHSLL
jgi:hypothetical protein